MSAAIFDSTIAFLVGDGDATCDVKNAVNNEIIAAPLVPNSVIVARDVKRRTRRPRRQNAPPVTIEIVPAGPWPAREIGIGWKERDVVLDLEVTVTQKDTTAGTNQLELVQAIARALVGRYDERSNLAVPAAVPAVFRRSTAQITGFDEIPEAHETVRGSVRVVFTWTEPEVDNT